MPLLDRPNIVGLDNKDKALISRSSGYPIRFDINRHLQSQKMARSLKFRIYEEEELYYPSGENKGADQLCSYCFGKNPVFS